MIYNLLVMNLINFSGSVKLRALNKTWGRFSGGEQMHVIGSPFIQGLYNFIHQSSSREIVTIIIIGPALSLIIRTPHGDAVATNLEYFSDSVLFFELPPYPVPSKH
jgi:hypothetical protein